MGEMAAAAPCATRRPFRESLKVLEADIQHANTLASDFSPDYDGAACLQMGMPYIPAARSFLSPCSGPTAASPARPASSGSPSSTSDADDPRRRAVCSERHRRRDGEGEGSRWLVSETDAEIEGECGIIMELNSRAVLHPPIHDMCIECYRQCMLYSKSVEACII